MTSSTQARELAQRFHETYERLAPSFGYETRKESAKPWSEVPDQNKRLMIAVCAEILPALSRTPDTVCPQGEGVRETFESIAAWCEETFGPVEYGRIAERANEEMKELLENPTNTVEAADVLIVLSRYPNLWQAVEQKMAVNRARKWRLMGDGTGYHVPTSLTTPEDAARDD